MAIQNGTITVSGKLGELVFYRRKQKYVGRKISKPYQLSAESIKSSTDFGQASKNAAYLRKAFAPLVAYYADTDIVNRLNAKMNALFKKIPDAFKGQKKLRHADLSQLADFQFNAYTNLNRLLLALPSCNLAQDGLLTITLPKDAIKRFAETNKRYQKLKLQLMVFNLGFEAEDYELFQVNDLVVAINQTSFPEAKVVVPTQQGGERALVVALGAAYCYKDNERTGDRRHFACQFVYAANVCDGKVVYPEQKVVAVKPVEEVGEDSGISWVVNS